MAPPLRVPRAGLPLLVLAQSPMSLAAPPPPSGHPGAGPLTPAPRQTPGPARARSTFLLCPSSTVALAFTAAQATGRPYICLGGSSPETFTWYPKCSSRSQSRKRRDQLEGGSRGKSRATEGHGPLGHGNAPTTRLYHSSNQLWATMVCVLAVGRHGQAGGLPG